MPMARSIAASTPHSAQASSSTSVSESLRITPAGGGELAADVAVVVDLAVEGDDVAAVGGMHRLRAAGAEIDDGEPALAQRHAALGLDPDAAAVRPAMAQRVVHGFADRAQRVGSGRRPPIDHAGNTAHHHSR